MRMAWTQCVSGNHRIATMGTDGILCWCRLDVFQVKLGADPGIADRGSPRCKLKNGNKLG